MKYDKNIKFPEIEKMVCKYWREIDAFEQSKKFSEGKDEFVFYDGPPFATGLPHYGHILSGTIKDILCRFMYQQGFKINRRFGWDCHGLPIEYEIDKQLGIKERKDILEMGIDKYNKACRGIVMKYSNEWEEIVERMGRWVDFKNGYKTMDVTFMESTWNIFKELWKRNLIYRGYKIMPFSTGCKTPLSNFEANQNYREVNDPSILLGFKLRKFIFGHETELVVWTTTPWTLPANCALIINSNVKYVILLHLNRKLIICANRVKEYFPNANILHEFIGSELLGIEYEPLFNYYSKLKEYGYFRILHGDFVNINNGTGIVHCAPGFGEDDYNVFVENNLIFENEEVPCPVDENGKYTIGQYKGMYVKDIDKIILKDLGSKVLMNGRIVHSYPYCWRSDTPLLYKLTPNWFIRVRKYKKKLLANNEQINWVPETIKYKRFHNWLEQARDWAIGRNRFWGTPIPIWIADDGDMICIGSIQELKNLSGIHVIDLHREYVDNIIIIKDGKEFRRCEEVLDCWFESGSMPYSQDHWPFCDNNITEDNNNTEDNKDNTEDNKDNTKDNKDITEDIKDNIKDNKDITEDIKDNIKDIKDNNNITEDNNNTKDNKDNNNITEDNKDNNNITEDIKYTKDNNITEDNNIIKDNKDTEDNNLKIPYLKKKGLPANFIGEGLDQTRGWFYTLHVLSTLLFDKPAFKNVICFGIVLAEDGKKMSKRLKNYPDPTVIFETHGADALRLYLISSPVVLAENLKFSENGVKDILKTIILPWKNVLCFYIECTGIDSAKTYMDDWISTSLDNLCYFITQACYSYTLNGIINRIALFIDDLSNWYVRINRNSLRIAPTFLGQILLRFSIIMAPFTPFFSEYCYQIINNNFNNNIININNLNINNISTTKINSVHFCMFPHILKQKIVDFQNVKTVIDLIRQMRESMILPLKRPLKYVEIVASKSFQKTINSVIDLIKQECNIIRLNLIDTFKYEYSYSIKPCYTVLRRNLNTMKFKLNAIKNFTENNIIHLLTNNSFVLNSNISIYSEDVIIERKFKNIQNSRTLNDFGVIFDISIDEEIIDMKAAREFYAFIQKLRKTATLKINDIIGVHFENVYLRKILSIYYPSVIFKISNNFIIKAIYSLNNDNIIVSLYRL